MEAAGKLFVAKGVEATTMDEVAASARVAKGTLYHYFASKAELIEALRGSFRNEFMTRIRTRVEACASDDWTARLRAWVDAAVNAYFDMSGLHDVVFHDATTPLRHAMTDIEINRYLAGLINDGTKAGVWYADDAAWAAVIMYYALHGGCDEARLGRQKTENVSEKLSALFLRMLGGYE